MGLANKNTVVKFGCFLYQDGLAFEDVRKIAHDCEEMGFSSLWLKDHLSPWVHMYLNNWPEPSKPYFLECLTTLAALAMETERLRLGAILCNTFRNPALAAKMIATLDVISNGRMEFGLSAGWNRAEHDTYGIEFPAARDRVARLGESLEIIKRMLTQSQATFHGEFYNVNGAVCEPKPIQQPHPPVWVGGASSMTLKLAAKHADGWNYGLCSQESYAKKHRILNRYCLEVGREPSSIKKAWQGVIALSEKPDPKQGIIGGSTSRIEEELRSFVELGVDHFTLHFKNPTTLRTFASEIMPLFA